MRKIIADHGIFSLYTPKLPDNHPFKHASTVLFLRNQAKADWYDLVLNHGKEDHRGATYQFVAVDAQGVVVSQSADPSMLWPIDLRVIVTDGPVDPEEHRWDGTGFGPRYPPAPADFTVDQLEFRLGDDATFSAHHNGRLVAHYTVGRHPLSGLPTAVRHIWTDPGYRRRGVMTALVHFIERTIGQRLVPPLKNSAEVKAWRANYDRLAAEGRVGLAAARATQ